MEGAEQPAASDLSTVKWRRKRYMWEKPYNRVDLISLRTGDRVGLRLSVDGALVFTVNGELLGVAATDVYRRGYDVYAVVEHFGPHRATRIVQSALGE